MEEKKGIAVAERLKLYAREHGIPQSRFQSSIGKKGAYLAQVKNPTAEVLVAACDVYKDLSPEWLLMGTQPKEVQSDEQRVEFLKSQLAEARAEIDELKMEIHLLKNRNNA